MTNLERYSAAMLRGDHAACIDIELRHGVYGYPPELVTIGLQAVDAGRNAYGAVQAYLEDMEDDHAAD